MGHGAIIDNDDINVRSKAGSYASLVYRMIKK